MDFVSLPQLSHSVMKGLGQCGVRPIASGWQRWREGGTVLRGSGSSGSQQVYRKGRVCSVPRRP